MQTEVKHYSIQNLKIPEIIIEFPHLELTSDARQFVPLWGSSDFLSNRAGFRDEVHGIQLAEKVSRPPNKHDSSPSGMAFFQSIVIICDVNIDLRCVSKSTSIYVETTLYRNKRTVPLKCNLTVSTRNLILDPQSFRESSFEAWVSSFDFRGSSFDSRGSRTKFRGSSFKFRDTRRIFWGSRTEISRKRFNSRKQNNSNEQNNWHAALLMQTRCWMYPNIFSCCAFSTRHMRFAYLSWSWWQQTSLASKCIYNLSCRNEWLFCMSTTRSKCVVFICTTSTGRSKRKQTLTAKKCFSLRSPPDIQKF